MHRRFLHLSSILLFMLVSAILAPALGRGFERVRHIVPQFSPDDGLEGTLVAEARLVRAGQALYRPIVPDEFVSAPYTPGYTLVLALFPFNPAAPFTTGRIISLVAMLVVAFGLFWYIGQHTQLWWIGGIAAVFWLSFAPTQLWATRVKPDSLALACTMTGLAIASVRGGRYAIWAALPFSLAFFTKQTAVIAPLAVGLNLLFTDWRRALRFAAMYVLAVGLPYLSLEIATGGWAGKHIWGLHPSAWWSARLFWKYVRLLRWSLPLVGLALVAFPRGLQQYAYRQALLYALLAPLTLYAAGEIGAHHNHLLETMMAWTLAGSLAAGIAIGAWNVRPLGPVMAAGALAGVLIQASYLRTTPQWYRGEFGARSLDRFIPYIQSKPGPVLADNVALLVAAGKAVRFDDPSTMGPAIRSKLWDPSRLHEAITRQEFSLILLDVDLRKETTDASGRWTDETLCLIKQYYKLEFRDTINAYVPQPRKQGGMSCGSRGTPGDESSAVVKNSLPTLRWAEGLYRLPM